MSTKYPTGTRPTTPEELHRHLAQFSGTERYYRIHPGLLATDGAKYLADEAGAYWLLDIIWSVLSRITDEFAVFELELEEGSRRAVVVIDDGREPKTTYHRQEIPYTDFPLPRIKLYLQQNGLNRVVMLPSEY
jgi:hypothetical protein